MANKDKAILATIRKLIKQHRAEIADKMNVDGPAVPRRDDQGNDITGQTGKKHVEHERRATHRQFRKVTSESASDTQEQPEVDDTKPKAKTPKAKAKSDTPVNKDGAKSKSAQIVINPEEDDYDNNALFKNGKNTNMKEEYLAWLAEFVDNNAEP